MRYYHPSPDLSTNWLRSRHWLYALALGGLLVGLLPVGCAQEMTVVREDHIVDMDSSLLQQLQFFSGENSIVFQADSTKIAMEIWDEELPAGKVVTKFNLIIAPNTAGRATYYDPVTRELFILFDEALPALSYMNNGRGLALTTKVVTIEDVTYYRVPRFTTRGIATSDVAAPLYLISMKASLDQIRVEDRKAKGAKALD
ncbi:MAG: hypothetical protein V3W14_09515 [Candidatus Neomarinimicrobiota bacterium]